MADWSMYTLTEAARRLGVSRQRVGQFVAEGRLGTIRQGGRVFVSGHSLRLLIADREGIQRKLRLDAEDLRAGQEGGDGH